MWLCAGANLLDAMASDRDAGLGEVEAELPTAIGNLSPRGRADQWEDQEPGVKH